MQTRPIATPRTDWAAAAVRRVFGVLIALVLVLAQTVPADAARGAGQGDGSGFIEICSDSGARTIPSPNGDRPMDCDCDLCDCCLTGSSGPALVPELSVVAVIHPDSAAMVQLADADLVVGRARVLWPETRGPPETKKSENMTATQTTRPGNNGGTATDMGGIPCV